MKPDLKEICCKMAAAARALAHKYQDKLEQLKANAAQLERPDFLWHYLLQSFATMGRAAGWQGLIGNREHYEQLRYDVLAHLNPEERRQQVERVCQAAKIRMPLLKAKYILGCFRKIEVMGGPVAAKRALLRQPKRDGKIQWLKELPGIGEKYARNIMMDVYHEDFRNSIAIDARIKDVSKTLGLSFNTYFEQEQFYLSVAKAAGLNGWELDRLIFNFKEEFLALVKSSS